MDKMFSTAVHMLILISESESPMSSEEIAVSVGTNPSYIRKVAGLLKQAGLIESRRGVAGVSLLPRKEDVALLDIYRAVEEKEQISLFDLHQNPNDACIVGRHIRPVLGGVFREIEEKTEQALRERTLSQVIEVMRKREESK